MFRKRIAICFMVIFHSVAHSNDQLGSIFMGADYLTDNEYNETHAGVYKLQKTGFALGMFLPIQVSGIDCHYKIKVSTHSIERRAWDWSGSIQRDDAALFDRHVSALNEILVGKEIKVGGTLFVLPQIGLGVQLDALDQNDDSPVGGIVYSVLFTDLSSRLRHQFRSFGAEIIGNYQIGVLPSWKGYEATDRIAIALGLYK
jgi:hypothetical protein